MVTSDLYAGVALSCLSVFVFMGGWFITLGGVAICLVLRKRPGQRRSGDLLLAGCFAPFAYFGLWWALAQSHLPDPENDDPYVWLAMLGFAASLFAAPVMALGRTMRPSVAAVD